MFAVASRWCDDPRVIPDNVSSTPEADPDPDDHGWRRAGLTYFETAIGQLYILGVQVECTEPIFIIGIHRIRRSLMHPTCLFEVETFTVSESYLRTHLLAFIFRPSFSSYRQAPSNVL
jgi:hypothetical protein